MVGRVTRRQLANDSQNVLCPFQLAITVGPNVFKPDSNTLVEFLILIQNILLLPFCSLSFVTS